MEGWIHLGLEREPSFFRAEGLLGETTVMVAREGGGNGPLIGACACTWMPVHLNGEVRRMPYLGGLRVASAFRHRPHLIREGFRALAEVGGFAAETALAFTSLARENHRARRLLERGLPGLPRYTPLGELETWVLPARGEPTGRLHAATASDLPDLIALINETGRASHLSPQVTERWLAGEPGGLRVADFLVRREGAVLETCVALWDQRSFKQVRVHGYRAPLNLLRVPWNLWSAVRGGVKLPAPKGRLEAAYLAFASFRSDDWEAAALDITDALAWAAQRGVEAALLGLPSGHPLGSRLRRGRTPWTYPTCIEAVRWPEATPLVLDARPVHPEIALL
jgi:hypothetical protein